MQCQYEQRESCVPRPCVLYESPKTVNTVTVLSVPLHTEFSLFTPTHGGSQYAHPSTSQPHRPGNHNGYHGNSIKRAAHEHSSWPASHEPSIIRTFLCFSFCTDFLPFLGQCIGSSVNTFGQCLAGGLHCAGGACSGICECLSGCESCLFGCEGLSD
jgi:hypothetical protein